MTLEQVRSQLAAFLTEGGVNAMESWPAERRTDRSEPVALVSLLELSCAAAGLLDYLGQRLDEATGQWNELYGRKARLTFALDIVAPVQVGAQACRAAFERTVRLLQSEKPVGLSVRELSAGEVDYDEKEGLLKLRCTLVCDGWLYTAGEEAGTFFDFTLRGDVKT